MTIEIRVPQLPESVADASIAAWVVKVGDHVTEDQNLLELETDKVVLEVPAPASGVLLEIKAEEGATVLGGDLIGIIDETASASTSSDAAPSSDEASAAPGDVNASPSVRKTMAEQDIHGASVTGSGKNGRILKEDLNKGADAKAAPAASAPAKKAAKEEVSVDLSGREERRVPMTRLRAKIAERLLDAQHHA